MTGGDTMVNVLKELGATGIEMIDYVIPQTDMVRIIGGDYAGLICVGKGGLTGPEDIISIIVDRIYQEAQQYPSNLITNKRRNGRQGSIASLSLLNLNLRVTL